ncbi:MAG: aspartyl protease family protein [Spirochaetia bacterium]|jgi:predicted aspartyl protease
MGTFSVDCEIQVLTQDRPAVEVSSVMVDTGSEYTWLPEEVLRKAGISVVKKDISFLLANGTTITRDVGYAFLRSGQFETVDEVVFGRTGDLRLLGARTLEGFAARADPRERRLVAAGALPAAPG